MVSRDLLYWNDSATYWANKSQKSWPHKWNLADGNPIGVDRYHLNTWKHSQRAFISYFKVRLIELSEAGDVTLLSYLKSVFSDSRQTVVHVASSARVDDYLPYFICFT